MHAVVVFGRIFLSVAVIAPVGVSQMKLNPITDNIMNRIHQKMSLEQKIHTLKLLLHMTLTELLLPLAITTDQAKRLESSVEIDLP